ncbi:MAG: uroporphyrinogen decarboxylase family protein [Bacillota bacterium]|nr:uroporphyrinogen decarboxylase family protein [Bacillota bacterium]
MTSKERVRAAFAHAAVDRVPAAFEAVSVVNRRLLAHYGLPDHEALLRHFEIDTRYPAVDYTGPTLPAYTDADGYEVTASWWGTYSRSVWTGKEYHGQIVRRPLDAARTLAELQEFRWPDPDDFDYEGFGRGLDRWPDRAIVVGHAGPFQMATALRSMESLFIDMALEPELAHFVYDRMVAFELEHYERLFEAAGGRIDVLRVHDDYGTQRSLLLSVPMWRQFFARNTRRLTELAHAYGAFYLQHSCGAVADVIPELVGCGVDGLEPVQKVAGLEPEKLKAAWGSELLFHGGIDTQGVLPFGSVEDVRRETRHYIDTLAADGSGYILMASQAFEGDVPLENIEALYAVSRVPGTG